MINPNIGLSKVRGASSINNAQFNDPTGSQKTVAGSPISISLVVASSTTATPVANYAIVRVTNTAAVVAFFWVGLEDVVPGVVSAANGVAIPPNWSETFCLPASADPMKAVSFKTSAATVQCVVMES